MVSKNEDEIRHHAYHLWVKEGRPEGRHKEHWHQAARELAQTDKDPDKKETAYKSTPASAGKKGKK